jgi:hypothetical protein
MQQSPALAAALRFFATPSAGSEKGQPRWPQVACLDHAPLRLLDIEHMDDVVFPQFVSLKTFGRA